MIRSVLLRRAGLTAAVALLVGLSACGHDEPAPPPAAAPPVAAPAPAPAPVAQILSPTTQTWSPEAMEELLAPVALYPDVVLGQVLVASTNPQEVLDAGNWLLQNQALQANALDEAAKQVGFTPPVRGLLQSPEVVDMMCSQLGWTSEIGQAFVNDQQGVLDAVQRLRAQAKDVGNLASSAQMTVGAESQDGKEVITVSPPSKEVVYVPQYDPVAVYAPPPATLPAPAAVEEKDKGHSTTSLVMTGLLSFGAGILVANIFDDDDDDYYKNGYYNPRYYGPPMPYYPPYPYRPNYGNGYYPNNGYNRPPNYQHSFNNNTIIVNTNNNNDYWSRHDARSPGYAGSRSAKSPITAAKPNRPELNTLNAQAKQGPQRKAPAQPDWKGQTGYAGAKPAAASASPQVKAKAADARPAAAAAGNKAAPPAPRPQAKPATTPDRPAVANRSGTSPPAKPSTPKPVAPKAAPSADHGAADKAAAQRAKQSLPATNTTPKSRPAPKPGDRKPDRK